MIRVICILLIVAIKDLKECLSNSNLPIKKKVICFEILAQKNDNGKQMTNVPYEKN